MTSVIHFISTERRTIILTAYKRRRSWRYQPSVWWLQLNRRHFKPWGRGRFSIIYVHAQIILAVSQISLPSHKHPHHLAYRPIHNSQCHFGKWNKLYQLYDKMPLLGLLASWLIIWNFLFWTVIIIIIICLSWSWATCWPVPVSRIQKSLQRSAMIPSANWRIAFHYPG